VGTELSPEVVRFGVETFGARIVAGLVEDQDFKEESFDVIVMNDVLEHLPDPFATVRHCSRLLSKGGFLVIQTPEYKEHLGYADLKASSDLFLRHMDGNNDEHLYLFSRRSAGILFSRLGLEVLDFSAPFYPYDMSFVASRAPLQAQDEASISAALQGRPVGRLVQALLDKAFESADRGWAIRRLEERLDPPAAKRV
jgi:SAM-dependent methyltransferase